MIPKIIHYCWFGDAPIKDEYSEYIKEWKQLNPSFRIKEWNNDNIPLNIPYLNVAFEQKNWANVSNYVRLYALRTEGGIYMDTDMKVLGSLDSLIQYSAFLGFESGSPNNPDFWVNNAIMGAVPGHRFLKECETVLLTTYDGKEKANLSAPHLITSVLKNSYGLTNYGHQLLNDIVLFEKEVFYPLPFEKAYLRKYSGEWGITSNTLAIHMWGRSWFSQDMMLDLVDFYQSLKVEQEHINIDLRTQIDKSQQELETKKREVNAIQIEFQDLKGHHKTIEDLSIICKDSFLAVKKELLDHKIIAENQQSNLLKILNQLREIESNKTTYGYHFETLKLEIKQLDILLNKIQKRQIEQHTEFRIYNELLLKLKESGEHFSQSIKDVKQDFATNLQNLKDKNDDAIRQIGELTKVVIQMTEVFSTSQRSLGNDIQNLKNKNEQLSENLQYVTQQNKNYQEIILDYKKEYEESSISKIVINKIFNKRKK